MCTLRSPLTQGHTHLLLARGLSLALLYGHLQPQVIPTADPLLLIHPEWQAERGQTLGDWTLTAPPPTPKCMAPEPPHPDKATEN